MSKKSNTRLNHYLCAVKPIKIMARTYYGDLESADKTVFMFDSHGSSKTDLKDGVFTVIVNTETEEAVAETYDTITAEQYSEFCCTVSAIQRIHPTRPPQWK